MKKNNNKGFTLMEMLIVVAIIAVLVAIAIPVFTNQLEKAREATDAANIRSAYAEVMACAMTNATQAEADKNDVHVDSATAGGYTYSKHVSAVQKQADWQSTIEKIAGKSVGNGQSDDIKATTIADGWNIVYDEATGDVTITNAAKNWQ